MIITGRWVLPITSAPLADGAVLIKGNLIADIGAKEELKQKHPGEEILDFKDAVIMPGFVDAHTHLEYSPFRGLIEDLPFWGWKLEISKLSPRLTESDWEYSAELGVLETIRAGITTIGDITRTGASLRAAVKAGLRG